MRTTLRLLKLRLGPPPTDSRFHRAVQTRPSQRYVTDRALATAIFLAMRLPKPLLLEGEAGVGKTEGGQSAGYRDGRGG